MMCLRFHVFLLPLKCLLPPAKGNIDDTLLRIVVKRKMSKIKKYWHNGNRRKPRFLRINLAFVGPCFAKTTQGEPPPKNCPRPTNLLHSRRCSRLNWLVGYRDFAGKKLLADVRHDGFPFALRPYKTGTGIGLLIFIFAGSIYLDNINAKRFGPEIYT